MGVLRAPWWIAFAVAVGWEFAERPLKNHVFYKMTNSTQDTLANSVVDVAATMTGWGAARLIRKRSVSYLPGGRGAGKRPGDFDLRQLRAGKRIEQEHTSNPTIAQEIAMDHLTEDPRYYTKLCNLWPDESGCELLR